MVRIFYTEQYNFSRYIQLGSINFSILAYLNIFWNKHKKCPAIVVDLSHHMHGAFSWIDHVYEVFGDVSWL